MAERSGFFDAHLVNGEYDRVYLAETFAKYFASFIGNGIFGGKSNELMVQQKDSASMSIKVLSGQGWINGYWYENTSELSLALDIADGVLNRIDLVVLRWDNSERVVRLAVKKGTPSSYPSAPVIQRDADCFELKLAEINVKAGATKITGFDITDTRLNTDECGFVVGVVKQFDTQAFGTQLNTFITEFVKRNEDWLAALQASGEADINALIAELEELIDSNDVASLNNKIVTVTNRVITLESEITTFKNLFIQSSQHPGCFYRIVNGDTEWINPPNMPGIEYLTTERWNGNRVYTKTLYLGALSNKTIMALTIDVEYDKVFFVSGYAFDPENNMSHPFPIIINGLTPVAVICGIEGNGAESNIIINVNENLSAFSGYITIKYIKT